MKFLCYTFGGIILAFGAMTSDVRAAFGGTVMLILPACYSEQKKGA